MIGLLYLFFALEALLGDKREGLKAHGLAFRQAMLGHHVTGMFSHPNETWFLYDQVRSGAVHGEDAPAVDWDTVRGFAWTVRTTLNHYLSLTSQQNIERRAVLLKTLDQHQDQALLVAWLRVNGGPIWSDYLDEIAERSGVRPVSTAGPRKRDSRRRS